MADDLTIALGTGSNANTATKDKAGVHYQVHHLGKDSRSDTYTATGSGTAVDVTKYGARSFALQVKGTGAAPTAFTVLLEGSLDGTNFIEIMRLTEADGDGAIVWTGVNNFPCLYFRSRCTALTLGSATNIVASIVGM